jgi:hypothetical protein
MTRALPWLVVFGLAVAVVFAARFGIADERVADINGRLNEIAQERTGSGVVPSQAFVRGLDQEMASALKLAPKNGFYELAHLRLLRTPRQFDGGVVQEDIGAARAVAERAVVRLPRSPYAWGDYALVADRLNAEGKLVGGIGELSRALRMSQAHGSREPTVAAAVLSLGLANWSQLDSPTRQSIERALSLLATLSPGTACEIAAFRGAIPLVCEQQSMRKYRSCAQG